MDKSLNRISKFLSLVLRHQPETIGLSLDENGWADIDELLVGVNQSGHQLDRDILVRLVRENDKQRFAIDEVNNRIRANQGHSVEVDLDLTPIEPPAQLLHGTVERFLESIMKSGLISGARQHVHLTDDMEVAKAVGQRRGAPIVLLIDAAAMHAAGYEFFLSNNGVWLTDHVPVQFIHPPK